MRLGIQQSITARVAALAACVVLATGSEAKAQTTLGPRRIPTFASFGFAADSVLQGVTPTQWKKGAAIGSIALGVPVLVLALGFCGDTDAGGNLGNGPGCVVGATAVGALTGAVIGGLIGGLFPKASGPTVVDEADESSHLDELPGPELPSSAGRSPEHQPR